MDLQEFENNHRRILELIADRVMKERGLAPEFSQQALDELGKLQPPAAAPGMPGFADLTQLLWCSIDNDDSRDLDQLTAAEQMPDGTVKVLVAIADVDSLVKEGMALDGHAHQNTTSVYTAARIFPMLPERLSTDLTSLNRDEDRRSMVIEMIVVADGSVSSSNVYPAIVRNKAKLAYNSVAAWLEGTGAMPEPLASVSGLDANLRLQDATAQKMRGLRFANGALGLETAEGKARFENDVIIGIEEEQKNRATDIIEDFMIAANGVSARFLAGRGFPSLRRVVRTPKRWNRIVELALQHGYKLPPEPDSKALDDFLNLQREHDPVTFPDISLAVVKLLGAGEYIAELPDEPPIGHFGLAVKDYTHSTAPNRRYPDLITQRLLKAAVAGKPCPYANEELDALGLHCTEAEDAANKVERQVNKSAAALFLKSRVGEEFEAVVTGASPKGTWARILHTPIEGRLIHGYRKMDVGDRLRVKLVSVDVERGFIDFVKTH
jgi:ribonuclease R